MTDTEMLDWLEKELRCTGRGNISLVAIHDYNMPRLGIFRGDYEVKDSIAVRWPRTFGHANGIRKAIEDAVSERERRRVA